MLISYRTGRIWAPRLEIAEALRVEALHFNRCVEAEERPITNGACGLRVVRTLQAATACLRGWGQLVELAAVKSRV